jgi:hypothetical protein
MGQRTSPGRRVLTATSAWYRRTFQGGETGVGRVVAALSAVTPVTPKGGALLDLPLV